MDVDGFDPYEDEYEWRDALEVMGEQFQEKLAEKGIKRRQPIHPKERTRKVEEQHVPGTVLRKPDGGLVIWTQGEWKPYVTGDPVSEWLNDGVVASDDLPRKFVECTTCRGAGGGMMSNGDWEECDECRGTGEIPNPGRPLFKFTGF